MLVELHRKAGTLCEPARRGEQKCPLIVRSTSEDNITAHLVHALGTINPRHWLSDFLNLALGSDHLPRQVYRRFRITPWAGKPTFPRDLIYWDEGGTEVDIQLTWENPPTTVFVECKYSSALSTRTSQNDGTHGYPGDQLCRNIRVGLHECGYYQRNNLFSSAPRRFAVILLSPETGNPLVTRYRDPNQLKAAIPHADQITWPNDPVVGEIGYRDIQTVLSTRRRFMARPERHVVDTLLTYLALKLQTRPNRLPLPTSGDADEHGDCRHSSA